MHSASPHLIVVLASKPILLGLIPLLTILLTAVLRRLADGLEVFVWQALDVGLDLTILAMLTDVTALVVRQEQITSLTNAAAMASEAGSNGAAADLDTRISSLNSAQVATAALLVLTIFVSFFLALWLSQFGREDRPDMEAAGAHAAREVNSQPTRRGVVVSLGVGVLVLVVALAVSK